MKKTFVIPVLLLFLSAAILLPGCAEKVPQSETNVPPDNRVFVSGSAAVMPLLEKLAAAFAVKEPDVEITFLPSSHSQGGVAGTAEVKYDIGAVSRDMKPAEKESVLQYLHLAIDGMVFVTNKDVPIRSLDATQLAGIYSGSITNWSQVGGPDLKIAVIDRPEHTSAKMALRKAFLGNELQITKEAVILERPWQVTESIQMIPNSIGYTSLGEIISDNPNVNMLSINRIEATPTTIMSGQYKFFRPFGLVIGPEPKVSTMRFVNFMFSETGSKIIRSSGYVPQRYEIVIGIVPERDPMVQKQRYAPLTEYLSQKLGDRYSVRLRLFPTYTEVCQALAKSDINAAFLGSFAYTTVREYVDVLARPDYNGISTYRGILFVRADSGIDNLEQMRGKRLVMGGKTTTAGYVFPLYYFKKNGISDYRTYFSEANFVGTHEDAILAVLHNRADIGAAKDLIFNMIATENPSLRSAVKILAESPAVPSNAFVIRKDIAMPCFDCHQKQARDSKVEGFKADMNISEAIRGYLLSMSEDPDGKRALAALGNATRFLETKDADYAELYKMLNEIHVRPQRMLNGD